MDVYMSITLCGKFIVILEKIWRFIRIMAIIGMHAKKTVMFACVFTIQLALLMTLLGCEQRDDNMFQSTSKVSLPNGIGTIGIVCRYKKRMMTSEGQERALMLELTNEDAMFFKYPETFAGDATEIEVYWHPKSQLLRLKDTAAKYHILDVDHECILDIEELNVKYVIRDPSGLVYAAKISGVYKEMPLGSSYNGLGTDGNVFPDIIKATTSPYDPVVEGLKAPICHESWTSEEGVLLGSLICE